jgi:hypothetical protein
VGHERPRLRGDAALPDRAVQPPGLPPGTRGRAPLRRPLRPGGPLGAGRRRLETRRGARRRRAAVPPRPMVAAPPRRRPPPGRRPPPPGAAFAAPGLAVGGRRRTRPPPREVGEVGLPGLSDAERATLQRISAARRGRR